MLEVRRGTMSLSGKNAGSPMTHAAPRTVPDTEPRPPMTTIATSMSESVTVKTRSLGTPCRLAASKEPPTAARPPARAKARSFVRVFDTV